MRLLKREMPKDWNYYLFGDVHIGASLFFKKGFVNMCNRITKDKKAFALDHGDLIEAITIDDKRFSLFDTLEATILGQMEMVRTLYRPISSKLLCMLDGNHPQKLHKFGPITHTLAKDLGVSYGTTTAKITFTNKKTGKLQFKHLATHGAGSISSIADDIERRKLNWRLSLKRKLRDLAGDALLMSCGHTHKIIINKPSEVLYLTDNGGEIESAFTVSKNADYIHPDYRFYVNTGSFLKIYSDKITEDDDTPIQQSKLGSGYAERAMYPPSVLGYCIAKIRNDNLKDVENVYI